MPAFPDIGVSHGFELLPALKKGDRQAILDFVRSSRPQIHGFLLCLVHSRETAEDITQEVMVRAY